MVLTPPLESIEPRAAAARLPGIATGSVRVAGMHGSVGDTPPAHWSMGRLKTGTEDGSRSTWLPGVCPRAQLSGS